MKTSFPLFFSPTLILLWRRGVVLVQLQQTDPRKMFLILEGLSASHNGYLCLPPFPLFYVVFPFTLTFPLVILSQVLLVFPPLLSQNSNAR